MATTITSECINCGACEPECPNTAIYQGAVAWQAPDGTMHPALSDSFFYIVPEKCTECVGFHDREACAAVCPVDCCVPDPERPESHEILLGRARVLHPGTVIPDDAPSRFRSRGAAAVSMGAAAPTPASPPMAPPSPPPPAAGAAAAMSPAPAPPAKAPAARPEAVAAPAEKPAAPTTRAQAVRAASPAPPPAAPVAGPRTFPGELPVDFDELLASLGRSRRRPRSPLALAGLLVLAAGQGVLGAMPAGAKVRLEAAVGDRRFFDAQVATAANVLLNLVLYPLVAGCMAVMSGQASLFASGMHHWILLGVLVAVVETAVRFREGLAGRMAPSVMPLRGALYGLVVQPLGALIARTLGVPEARADVGFDGYYAGREAFDDKRERARRYGEVYRLEEREGAYLLHLEFPRRVPVSSLAGRLDLPADMPDYDYELALESGAFVVHAHVADPRVRKLTGAAAAFPSDFTARVPLREPVTGFRHRCRDKTLEVVLAKTLAS